MIVDPVLEKRQHPARYRIRRRLANLDRAELCVEGFGKLVKVGVFGKDKSAVIRRFVAEGVQRAMATNAISAKNVDDFGDPEEDE